MAQLQVALLSFFLFFSSLSYGFEIQSGLSVDDSKVLEVSQSKAWHKLMHYRRSMWGTLRSDVDGKGYFFAEDGFRNPVSELRASLKALFENPIVGKLKMPFRCSFPERTRFLVESFQLPAFRDSCETLDRFMEQFHNPQSVSIVFSSAYPNNPASMFGHTFLKINSARNTDLLDTGLNFAAQVADDEGGLAFIWLGTTGGYAGQWSSQPYYAKVREYSNFESRDLWEYKLSLSVQETRKLLHHIWELEVNSYFDYFFFDENCSYQILAALEAIRPDWDFLRHKIYLIPGESVKYLTSVSGAVQDVKYRPSLSNRINSRYQSLSADENRLFHQVIEKKVKPEDVKNRLVAEALLTYYDYIQNDRPSHFEKTYAEDVEKMRLQRARLGLLTTEEEKRIPEIRGRTRPEIGHDSYSVAPSVGYSSAEGTRLDSSYLGFRIKSAYHDLLNRDEGYTPYAHIDFPYAEFRYYEKRNLWTLEELGGLGTTSITPITDLKTPISFRAYVGYRRQELKDDFDHHQVHAELGGGLSFYFLNELNRTYFLILAATDLSPDIHRGFGLLPGFEVGLLLNPIDSYKFQMMGRSLCDLVYSRNCYGQTEYQINQSIFLSRNQEIRNVNRLRDNAEKRGTTTFESNLSYIWFFN